MIKILKLISLLPLALTALMLAGCPSPDALNREELVARYPDVEQGSGREANNKIMCPFVRMLERSGIFDEEDVNAVPVASVRAAANEFGCGNAECGSVAADVATTQGTPGLIDLERFAEVDGIAHECGFTFEFGGTEISDAVRANTLSRLYALTDEDEHLQYADLEQVKLDICAEQNVAMSGAGELETKLIYAYLGGTERGYIEYHDVEALLNSEMPMTKAAKEVNAAMLILVR